MAWFSPIKGVYPGLAQIDKTLNADSEAEGIVRGSVVYVTTDNTFAPCTAAEATNPNAYVYFTLVGQDDFQAGMAGTVGYGAGSAFHGRNPAPASVTDNPAGTGKVTALAVGLPMEFQTDQFDAGATYEVGDYLTVGAGTTDEDGAVSKDGVLVKHTSGANVVAQVTAVPFDRWVNDAQAPGAAGRRTGANVKVIQARTVWIPTLTVA